MVSLTKGVLFWSSGPRVTTALVLYQFFRKECSDMQHTVLNLKYLSQKGDFDLLFIELF